MRHGPGREQITGFIEAAAAGGRAGGGAYGAGGGVSAESTRCTAPAPALARKAGLGDRSGRAAVGPSSWGQSACSQEPCSSTSLVTTSSTSHKP